MNWISRFRASGDAEPVDPDETIINGAPYDAEQALRSSREPPSPSGDRSAATAEEIKRRQISAVVRYVAAVRAR